MIDDTENIAKNTWIRNIEPVNKIGFMDGASDGQAAVFQTSFDMGYQQGYNLGLELGSRNAKLSLQQEQSSENNLRDPRKINCQICVNGIPSEQNVVNLYNTQQESNAELLKQKLPDKND